VAFDVVIVAARLGSVVAGDVVVVIVAARLGSVVAGDVVSVVVAPEPVTGSVIGVVAICSDVRNECGVEI
jgi:hypothetical protein